MSKKSNQEEDELKRKIRNELLEFMAEQATQNNLNQLSKGMPTSMMKNAQYQLSLPKTAHDRTVDLKKQLKKDQEKQQQDAKDFYKTGDIVDSRYFVTIKLKDGGFGQVYKVIDNKTRLEMALKVEKNASPATEYIEGVVLKAFQGHPNCPVLFAGGVVSNNVFIAMQLLGDNLSDIRRSCVLLPNRLSISAAYRTIIQCLKATEGLHNVGYIHRDVKPSNFVVGKEPKLSGTIYMLDFGLCRKFVNSDGTLKKLRDNVGFRGTVRYASLAAHEKKDLSRRDDLWSLFYTFVELLTGQLPWRRTNDKEKVAQMKLLYSPDVLCQVLPPEVCDFVRNLQKLNFNDKPDYPALDAILKRHLTKVSARMEDPYDWQVTDCKIITHWLPPNI